MSFAQLFKNSELNSDFIPGQLAPVDTVAALDTSVTVSPTTGDVKVSLPVQAGVVGSYTNANLTVNNRGIITAASNGTAGIASITAASFTGSVTLPSAPIAAGVTTCVGGTSFTAPKTGVYIITYELNVTTNTGGTQSVFPQTDELLVGLYNPVNVAASIASIPTICTPPVPGSGSVFALGTTTELAVLQQGLAYTPKVFVNNYSGTMVLGDSTAFACTIYQLC
jgi:hypothetical protein